MIGGPVGAAGLEVEHHAAVGGQRVRGGERLGAAEAGLLGVGEHDDDVVAQLRPLASARGPTRAARTPPRRRRRRPGPVSTESWWAIRNSRPVGSVPGRTRDDVADAGHLRLARPVLPGADGVLHPGVQAEVGERARRGRRRRGRRRRCRRRGSRAAIRCTCSNARAALNSSAGRVGGAGSGGCSAGDAARRQAEQQQRRGAGRRARRGARRGTARCHVGLLSTPGQDGVTLGDGGAVGPAAGQERVAASWSAAGRRRRRSSPGGTASPTAGRSRRRRRTGRRARPR